MSLNTYPRSNLLILFVFLCSYSLAYATGWEATIINSSSSEFYFTGDGKTGVYPKMQSGESVLAGYNLNTNQYYTANIHPEYCPPKATAYNPMGLHVIGGYCQDEDKEHLFTYIYNPQLDKLIKHPRIDPVQRPYIGIQAVNRHGVAVVKRGWMPHTGTVLSTYRVEHPGGNGIDLGDYCYCDYLNECTTYVDISDNGLLASNAQLDYFSSYTEPFVGPAHNPFKYHLKLPPDHAHSVLVKGITDNGELAYGVYIDNQQVYKVIVWIIAQDTYLTFAPTGGYSIGWSHNITMNNSGNAIIGMKDPNGKDCIGFLHGKSKKFYNVNEYTTPSYYDLKIPGEIDPKNNIVAFGMPNGNWRTYILKFTP